MQKYIKRDLGLTKSDFRRLKRYKGTVLSYAKICKILKCEMYAGAEQGGQQQFNHVAKMQRFCKLTKVSGGYLIEKVYNKEREIKKKRKRRCKYADASRLFEYNLAQQSKNKFRIVSKNRALEAACFVNTNFSVAKQHMNETAELLKVSAEAVEAVINYFGNKFKLCFKKAIDNARAIKEYETGVIVARKNSIHGLATKKELTEIQQAETKALRMVGCKTVAGAFVKGRYQKFIEKSKKALTTINYYYNGYRVELNHKAVQMTERTAKIAKANMQTLVEESILKSCEKKKCDAEYVRQIKIVINALIKDTDLVLAEHFITPIFE